MHEQMPAGFRLTKIVSGGQTGADRTGLDWAIFRDIPHGGWCPKGRRAEDGIIPSCYNLQETPSTHYSQRTQWNVRDADATVIFTITSKLSGGSRLTAEAAKKYGKPWIHISPAIGYEPSKTLVQFLAANHVCVLNVAGSRRSKEPEVAAFVKSILEEVFFPGPNCWIGGPDEG